jgi:hypothetical protein
MAMKISYEDAKFASNQIAHCVNNVLTVRILSENLKIKYFLSGC